MGQTYLAKVTLWGCMQTQNENGWCALPPAPVQLRRGFTIDPYLQIEIKRPTWIHADQWEILFQILRIEKALPNVLFKTVSWFMTFNKTELRICGEYNPPFNMRSPSYWFFLWFRLLAFIEDWWTDVAFNKKSDRRELCVVYSPSNLSRLLLLSSFVNNIGLWERDLGKWTDCDLPQKFTSQQSFLLYNEENEQKTRGSRGYVGKKSIYLVWFSKLYKLCVTCIY